MFQRCYGCMRELPAVDEACPHCGYDRRAATFNRNHLTPGSELRGRYVIGRALGLGSFGNTYIGWDTQENMCVTIKEFLPSAFAYHRAGDQQVQFYSSEGQKLFEKGLRTFAHETAVLQGLTEAESVSRILDYVSENGTGYAVMEYLNGETLKVRLARCRTMSFGEAMSVLAPVLRTLELVHQSGLLHRDISPDNIFLCDDGRVKLLDFGSAQFELMQGSEGLSVVLKHGYAPLERYVSHLLPGPWTDVFGAAATLYKMLTGIVPQDVLQRRREDTIVRPSDLDCVIPEYAETALMRALSLRPEDRYATAQAFLNALVPEEDEEQETNAGVSKALIFVVIAVIAVIAVLAVLLLTGRDRPKKPEPDETSAPVELTTEPAVSGEELQILYYEAFAPETITPVRTASGAFASLPYAVFQQNGKKGLVSRSGEIVLQAEYTSVVWDTAQQKFLLDGKTYWDEQSGITEPTESVPPEDGAPDLTNSKYQYSDTLYRVTKSGERIPQTAGEGSFLVGPPYGIVTRGSILVEQSCEKATPLSCGVSAMYKGGKWTYFNAFGVDIFGRSFDGDLFPDGTPYSFSEGYVPLYDEESGLWGYADTAGNTVYPPQFLSALPPVLGKAWVQTEKGFGTLSFMSDDGKTVGKCGENVRFTVQPETGSLVIEGYGVMWDFTEENVPWLSLRGRIRTVRFDGSISYIGANAFSNCTLLSGVTLPVDLQDIGPFAFCGCGMLRMLNLPPNLVTVGDEAFARCDELTDIILPESLRFMGYAAFRNDTALQNVHALGAVILPDYAFYGCTALATADLSNVTEIGRSAFEGCTALETVTLPSKASGIGSRAFYGCTALPGMRIPLGVATVEPSTFEGCTALTTVTLPDGLKVIRQDAFSGCSSLSALSLPPTLTQIGARAFYNCRGLQNALVPSSVTRIEDYAFAGCTGIASFELKDTVQTLGSHVFDGWTSQQKIWLKNPFLRRWIGDPPGWSGDWKAGCNASIAAA